MAAAGQPAPVAAEATPELEVVRVPALDSNYFWLLREPGSGATAVVDPGAAAPVLAELKSRGWGLDFVFVTHHHVDHVGGVLALKAAFPELQVTHQHYHIQTVSNAPPAAAFCWQLMVDRQSTAPHRAPPPPPPHTPNSPRPSTATR